MNFAKSILNKGNHDRVGVWISDVKYTYFYVHVFFMILCLVLVSIETRVTSWFSLEELAQTSEQFGQRTCT